MKKLIVLMVAIMSSVVMGCSTSEESLESSGEIGSTEKMQGEAVDKAEITGDKVPVQVIEVFGNEITVQIGTMEGANGNGPFGGIREEGIGEGESPEGAGKGERPEGMGKGERPEGMGKGERPEGVTQGGGVNGMARPMASSGEAMDISEVIQLTGEEVTYTIPVGTPVNQYGTEMTFSHITEKMYLIVTTDEKGTVLSVEILG